MRLLFHTYCTVSDTSCKPAGCHFRANCRDRFGRRLMAHFGSYSNEYPFAVRAKVVTYLCFGVLAEDVTTQRNGVVSLGFFSYDDNDLLVMERKGFLQFFQAVPLRWSGFHLCIPNNPAFNVVKGLMLSVIPKDMRRITRVHSGELQMISVDDGRTRIR